MASSIMLVGTASNVGKSVLCTALCRILAQDGWRVAPFKGQNMSLNSAVTPSGREIGRAQAVQAEAAGVQPNEHMNPVLLKPTGDLRTQVVLQGCVHDTVSARAYFTDSKDDLWDAVKESHEYLRERFDVIVMEGAGSPVEMNLKDRDITNLRAAEMADASVILVADIDRGGVFAAVVGTLQLMTSAERARVKGIIVNRFRGDPALFAEGVRMLEDYTGVPVLGVIPFIRDLGIDEEDSVGLQADRYQKKAASREAGEAIRVAIVAVPHLSNFTDFDPLFLERDVDAFFCTRPEEVHAADAIILPGTKSTISDLLWLDETGWRPALQAASERGTHILGICGGFQMLGRRVCDPAQQESQLVSCSGLNVFACETTISGAKRTQLVDAVLRGSFAGMTVQGYEIHMGETVRQTDADCFAQVYSVAESAADGAEARLDGAMSADGRIIGTYLHGVLHNDLFRVAWINRIRAQKGLSEQTASVVTDERRAAAYDRLAEVVRQHLNMTRVYEMIHQNPLI